MSEFTILYDHAHEANWFRKLHPDLAGATQESINAAKGRPLVAPILAYDRPDVILLHQGRPVLVVEETVEVPSGHNVGQRFARIAAAAEKGVPSVYFGPYVARKHGGKTAGPRYMNVRLFHAIDAMVRETGAAVTTVNWPVDHNCEVRRDTAKDDDMREYMSCFMSTYVRNGLSGLSAKINSSLLHQRLVAERNAFVQNRIRNPQQYDTPPESVEILPTQEVWRRFPLSRTAIPNNISEIILYRVGMNYIRSDPYTGMAMLYHYLYVTGHFNRSLVLWFPNITEEEWRTAARSGQRKDIRIFKVAADAIAFRDAYLTKGQL